VEPALRVLIADDETTLRDLLALNLEARGFEVLVAADGLSALNMVRKFHPDVVVLDIMMPKIDGLAVLKTLRAHPETANIRVVMLSAKATDNDMWDGWRTGADCYLTKPCGIGDILDAIRNVATSAALISRGGRSE
jgi:DNA-binding response OmpR family regulator